MHKKRIMMEQSNINNTISYKISNTVARSAAAAAISTARMTTAEKITTVNGNNKSSW
jgi:hypothetical protein